MSSTGDGSRRGDAEQGQPGQVGVDQGDIDRAWDDQVGVDQARVGQASAGQAAVGRTRLHRAGSGGARLDQARWSAGLVLWIEQLWPALLAPAFVIGLFALLSLLTVPQRLAVWLHAAVLLGLVAAVWWLVRRNVRGLSSPAVAMRDRRIERASRLLHRPLATLTDRPVQAGGAAILPAADLLWQAHLSRTQASLGALGAGLPSLSWRGHDRFGTGRALLGGVLLAALLSGAEAPLRLVSGFWPGIELPLGPRPALQAWITPPDYAGGAPVFLTDPHGRYVVPAGSTLSVSLTGSGVTPRLSGVAGSFARLSSRSWSLQHAVAATEATGIRLAVRQAGYDLADWRIVSQAAPAPMVAWTATPGADKTVPWRLRLPWSVAQPYGVRSLVAEIRLADPHGRARVLRVPVLLPGMPKQAKGVAIEDLSADPWAGAKVVARLVASDTSGQRAMSADAAFVLPSRAFRNPLARAVLDVRRRFATGMEPAGAAADDLAALGDTPGLFAQDSGLFLNLSSVVSLLRQSADDTDRDVAQEAIDRLWSLALALEDGLHADRAGARATAEMRRAQDRLSAQIEHMRQLGAAGQSQAEQDELKRRIAEMAQAIARKMQALAAEAAREHKPMPALPEQMTQGGDALSRMMKQMQEEAANGHSDQAMQNLSRMQQMLDHMRLATPQDLRSAAEQAQATAEARDQMQAVQDLVQRQTKLLDSAQGRQGDADRTRRDAEQRLQTDGEDAAGDGTSGNDPGGAPDAATRALLRQLGIPLDQGGGSQNGDGQSGDSQPGSGQPGSDQSASGQVGGGQNGSGPDRAQAGQDGSGASPGAGGPGQPDKDAARGRDRHDQGVLARALDELGQEFTGLTGKKADALNEAGQDMRQARDSLADGHDGDAADAQAKALAALQKGRNQMSAAMRGGRSGGTGLALLPGGGDGQGDGQNGEPDGAMDAGENGDGTPGQAAELGGDEEGPRDPLGRPTGEGNGRSSDGDETHVPGQDQSARSRQIEQELRRRDSDRTRSQGELDYLDRLLKPF